MMAPGCPTASASVHPRIRSALGLHVVIRVAGVHPDHGVLPGVLGEELEPLLALAERPLGTPTLGDVLDGEEDEVVAAESARVEHQLAPADPLELPVELVPVEGLVAGEDAFEELAELGAAPLPAAELVDEAAEGVLRSYLRTSR